MFFNGKVVAHSGVKGMRWGQRNDDTLRKYGLLKTAANAGGSANNDDEEEIEIIDPATGKTMKIKKKYVDVDNKYDGEYLLIDRKTGEKKKVSKIAFEAVQPYVNDKYYVVNSDNPDDSGAYRRMKNKKRNESYKKMVETRDEVLKEYNRPINVAKRFIDGLF